MTVSIICPTFNEENYICKCLDSLINNNDNKYKSEFIIVDGLSTDKTREILNRFRVNSNIIIKDNPKRYVSNGLNIGIKSSTGDIIIRIDAHCEYPSNYITNIVDSFLELNADNVGPVCKTIAANDSTMANAIAIGISHWFGVGNSMFRIGTKKNIETDTVPFGCFKREIFDKIGFFDEDLIRNQDDEFNGRIKKNGGKIFLVASIVVDYVARDSISKLSKMYYQYGLFKPLVNKKLKMPTSIRQFFPVVFVLGLVFGFALSFLSNIILFLYIFVVLLYIILLISISVKLSIINKKSGTLKLLPIVFFSLHLSYGIGYIIGIYRVVLNKKNNVEINR